METPSKAVGLLWGIIVLLVTGLAFGGWAAHDYVDTKLASKEEVVVAASKADFVMDQQMAATIAQIAYLERKPRKTADEMSQLQYLRGQLDIMRKIRSGR